MYVVECSYNQIQDYLRHPLNFSLLKITLNEYSLLREVMVTTGSFPLPNIWHNYVAFLKDPIYFLKCSDRFP